MRTTILIAVVLVVSHSATYFFGSAVGKANVTAEWAEDTATRVAAIDLVKTELANKQVVHALESKRITDAFNQLKVEHDKSVATLRNEYTLRLRTVETRSSIYQRQAEGSTVERSALANFTTKLDRTIEEGRGLVSELSETLRQCERQRQLYNEQIINDRLFN